METSNEMNSKEGPEDFGRVIDALHSKKKLPSLRTYQGDMAQFIKEKNESVITIAVKEKERKEERIESGIEPKPIVREQNFKTNVLVIIISLLFLAGGVGAAFYLFNFLRDEPVVEVQTKEEIIPHSNSIQFFGSLTEDLNSELLKIPDNGGISVVEIFNSNNQPLFKAKDFFEEFKISAPSNLKRVMQDDYALGTFYLNDKNYGFLIIRVDDFGLAFSAMLDWEQKMVQDLSFLNLKKQLIVPIRTVERNISSTTASTTQTSQIIETPSAGDDLPEESSDYIWKDIIIKNKDTRALVNQYGKSKMAYTFLDKNTILIVNEIETIGEITSIYISRSIAR